MIWPVIISVIAGLLAGRFLLPPGVADWLEPLVTYTLAIMVFIVGVDIGRNKGALMQLKQAGFRILLVPLGVALGTLLGALAAMPMVGLPFKEVAAVSAGFGWYSLSGVLIADIYSVELGATAFLSNVFRELIAFIIIPVVVGFAGKLAAIAPGGATTMDSTLPLITKVTDTNTGLIAFLNGLVLSAVVPLLVPFLLSL